jgi:hypothetical protein
MKLAREQLIEWTLIEDIHQRELTLYDIFPITGVPRELLSIAPEEVIGFHYSGTRWQLTSKILLRIGLFQQFEFEDKEFVVIRVAQNCRGKRTTYEFDAEHHSPEPSGFVYFGRVREYFEKQKELAA